MIDKEKIEVLEKIIADMTDDTTGSDNQPLIYLGDHKAAILGLAKVLKSMLEKGDPNARLA